MTSGFRQMPVGFRELTFLATKTHFQHSIALRRSTLMFHLIFKMCYFYSSFASMKNPRIVRTTLILLALLSFCASIQAKDDWLQIKTKNFNLIGNASEKDIRKVGTRLEQFRETFRLLFGNMNLTSPIQTNVVVFKSDSSYKTFKPKRADGKINNNVAGYFQPGEDVNYITLSTEGEDEETFSVIFHEYVHFIVNAILENRRSRPGLMRGWQSITRPLK